MNLKKIRNKIDLLDSKILKLLNDRMELAVLSNKFKSHINDKERENEILKRIKKDVGRIVDPLFCENMYGQILEKSKELQEKGLKIIAFQGEHGAYSDVAARVWDSSSLVPVSCNEFTDVFEGIKNGFFDYGIVPVENTLGGIVGEVNDLMIKTDLCIIGAVDLKIHHALMTLQDADHRELKNVYSHPQAISQCREFLSRNKLTPNSFYDTAGAARWLTEKQPKATAVIASTLAADIYNLKIIKTNIEDHETNRTRFLVLSKEENRGDIKGEKCSIVFSTKDKTGILYEILTLFAKRKINLTRIESVPSRPGEYAFFIDFLGGVDDKNILQVIDEVKKETLGFRLLGCYSEKVKESL
jgi:prephenate dehydratase/chorismate mutase